MWEFMNNSNRKKSFSFAAKYNKCVYRFSWGMLFREHNIQRCTLQSWRDGWSAARVMCGFILKN